MPSTRPEHPTPIDPEIAGKRLLILGGGLWQLDYVRRARALGLETWVTDWSPEAVARDAADHFEPIDLKDQEGTLALAERARIDAVLTAADIGVPTAAYVAERLHLAGHSRALAEVATNKLTMRQESERLGIPGPWYRLVRSGDEACEVVHSASLPVVVKPVDNCSSRGVRWVDRHADLRAAVVEALGASRARQALIEQGLFGTEGSIEALVEDGRPTVLGVCDKTKSPLPDRYDLELRYPGDFSPRVRHDVEGLARSIASGFEIRRGILHIEFLVSHDSETVYLVEFAIRGCGSKVVTHLLPVLTGVDVVHVLIRQSLGLRTTLEPAEGRHGALHFLLFPPGRVVAVRGVEAARRLPGVVEACVEPRPGEVLAEVHDGRSRPGHVLVWGASRHTVQRLLGDVRSLIQLDYEHAAGVGPLDPWRGDKD